ncbi:thiol:disulfide interchange protein DsbC [Collimonas sp. PA-H2]|uniref:DsbC family protein n=1 Tax=Collimonas sp. PA-H2 TaxID=1881062 RepID=UPI000BF80FD9|nr:DsbC family protein [Collimonas sp. PA-H2]PFH09127.1 thiol:disulfide interchange protein DsbC [Collimonas sp. PA-H2]
MKKTSVMLAVLMGLWASVVSAETLQEAAVKKLIELRLGEGAKVDEVTKTPYAGLFEVRVGSDIFYTDAAAKYVFVGRIMDAQSSRDFTRERVDELNKVTFADLPLDLAMKRVKGNGKRVIAVFEDPNCGYCKRFHKTTLQEIDNVTVYTFLFNILAEDSSVKARNVWCSADRNKAWTDLMVDGKAATAAPTSCQAPNDKVLALGQKLNVTGTPTIIFADGSRVPGWIDAKTMEAKFSSLK